MKANYTPLTPLAFLERSGEVFADKTAIVYNERRMTYREMMIETTSIANALRARGVEPGDRVAYLMPNIPEMLMAHFAVPLAGAVLVAINTRLSPAEISYILDHSGAKLLVADTELLTSLGDVAGDWETVSEIVAFQDIDDDIGDDSAIDPGVTATSYADFLAGGSDESLPWTVDDEMAPISINYTSGTTGRPKGVLYTHRGAYLNALGEIIHSRHTPQSVYLWTLPMFHCNGWCTTWGVTAIGGTHVCLRAVRHDEIWRLIRNEGVTHLNAAPTVLIGLVNHEDAGEFPNGLIATTAGAPPSPTLITDMHGLGADVVHAYGLTETYGPHTVCEVQPDWADLDAPEYARKIARQGVAMVIADPMRVVDDDMNDVPRDAETMGEVLMKGNNVMAGYYEDPSATHEAFRGGWFHSGDLGVHHPDGYIQLRDRSKDIIISGGENISTIEVEQAVMSHPAVLEAAVIAIPHEIWGERPKAFVILKPGSSVTEQDIIDHVKSRLASFKAPDSVEFPDSLPKTSTGKIQKYVLRHDAWGDRADSIN